MHKSVTRVMFVSKENAARSLLAEACLRHLGKSQFRAFSCGVPAFSKGQPNEWTLLTLKTAGIGIEGLHCKGWSEFLRNGAPRMDFVISLDKESASEQPMWPGQPETAVWAFPALVQRKNNSTDVAIATLQTLHALRRRIELLVSLHSKGKQRSDLRHDLRDMAYL
jgi:arsenate reductase